HAGPIIFLKWGIPVEWSGYPDISRRRVLTLHNGSDLYAHNIQVSPIKLDITARFLPIAELAPKKNAIVEPIIESDDGTIREFYRNDFEQFLYHPANLDLMHCQDGDGPDGRFECKTPIDITCTDSFGIPFVTKLMFWFDPLNGNAHIELLKRHRVVVH